MHLKISSPNCSTFCSGLDVLICVYVYATFVYQIVLKKYFGLNKFGLTLQWLNKSDELCLARELDVALTEHISLNHIEHYFVESKLLVV